LNQYQALHEVKGLFSNFSPLCTCNILHFHWSSAYN